MNILKSFCSVSCPITQITDDESGIFYGRVSSGVVLGPAASASPRNLLEMQILGQSHTYFICNSGAGAQQSVLINSPSGSDACSSLRTTALKYLPSLIVCDFHESINGPPFIPLLAPPHTTPYQIRPKVFTQESRFYSFNQIYHYSW